MTLHCSKYDEIGNPQARRKKHRESLSDKKWNRLMSYASSNSVQGRSKREQFNFMDSQMNNIYNSSKNEETREEDHRMPKALMSRSILELLPDTESKTDNDDSFKYNSNKSADRFLLNTMIR